MAVFINNLIEITEVPNALIKYVFDELEQHYVLLQEGPTVPSVKYIEASVVFSWK
jgi:hypothetical protein